MTIDQSLNLGRVLLIAALSVGLLSLRDTAGHIGDPSFLMPGNISSPTHGWYHFFREAGGTLAKMIALLLIFFGPIAWRGPGMWWIALILMIGYYGPFWVGEPFNEALSAPNGIPTTIHAAMTLFGLMALLASRRSFHTSRTQPSGQSQHNT